MKDSIAMRYNNLSLNLLFSTNTKKALLDRTKMWRWAVRCSPNLFFYTYLHHCLRHTVQIPHVLY